jgi:predicted dehydrogenase
MAKKLNLAIIGCGSFASSFVTLFKIHPLVEKVYVCDLIRERAETYSKKYEVPIIDSFEDALASPEIDSVAIFAERHLHGPLVIKALEAGKHVYSAVPMASEVHECQQIVETVKRTGLTYMMGETCYYYPSSMFCRFNFQKGTFGKFVYGEAQYHHDIMHFSDAFRSDKKTAGVPPFFYPTHSTAMLLAAADSYCTRVVAFGYEDSEEDGFFLLEFIFPDETCQRRNGSNQRMQANRLQGALLIRLILLRNQGRIPVQQRAALPYRAHQYRSHIHGRLRPSQPCGNDCPQG